MKRIIFFSFCAGLLFTGCATSQKAPVADMQEPLSETVSQNLNVISGAGLSNISGGKSWDPKLGGLVGVETKIHKLSLKSSIKTGINLSFQGANYTESYEIEPYGFQLKSIHSSSDEFSGKVTLMYINVPFLYSYKCDAGFYGEVGIQPSFLISAQDKPDGESSYDFKDYIKTFDLGIPLGFGYKVNEQLSIGARAVFGLTNINTDGTEMYSSDDTDRNFILFGVVGYRFKK